MDKITSVLFVYLCQEDSLYILTDEWDYPLRKQPKLGMQYLSAVLEKKGLYTEIIDESITPFTFEELLQKIKAFDMVCERGTGVAQPTVRAVEEDIPLASHHNLYKVRE